MALVLLSCVLSAINLPAQDKLVFAVDIIRHGDRTPTAELPGAAPALWPEGLGKLTAQGTNQEYRLGSRMRSLYLDRGLLGSNYVAGTICAFSTDMDRTRTSARLFLTGLLADASQPIPILTNIPIDIKAGISETNSISAATLLIPTDRNDFQALLSQYVFSTPEWLATNSALQPKFDRWSRAANSRITNAHDLIALADTFYIHQIHHVPVAAGLNPDDVQAIIEAGRWAFVYQYQADLGRVTGKTLLKKVAEYMNNAIQEEMSLKKTTLKYVLFSAHDSTLLSEMSALRAPLTGANAPPYASFLHFALFETRRANFYVQVTYNDDKDHVVPDPDSGGASWSLAQLLKLADLPPKPPQPARRWVP